MPTYCYRTKDGEIVERVLPMSKTPPAKVTVGGRVARRDYRAERVAVPPTAGWPLTCYASGVHPEQAGELRQYLADRGVPTEVTDGGDPVYTSAVHRRKALKVRGMFDRNSFI